MNPAELDITSSVNNLFLNFNKPILTKEYLTKWIMQFDVQDRETAIKLANAVDYNSYSDVIEKLIIMHNNLIQSLNENNFDVETFSNVDFTRAYTCKSGDIISYLYRISNKIRNVCFKTVEALHNQSKELNASRAIVILDDYTSTGDQFLSEFYARNTANCNLLNSYKKIYFMPIVANEIAVNKFKMLKQGKIEEVTNKILEEFALNHTDGRLFNALSLIQNNKLILINYSVEYPLLSPENKMLSQKDKEQIEKFLLKYNCGNPYGTGATQGHTTFFYSAPNSLPDILWNSKMIDKGLFPLFSKTNDISIYPMADNIELKDQVW